MSEELIFSIPRKKKYQVRFWASAEKYEEFTKTCDSLGLLYSDVFMDFMNWFVKNGANHVDKDNALADQLRGGKDE